MKKLLIWAAIAIAFGIGNSANAQKFQLNPNFITVAKSNDGKWRTESFSFYVDQKGTLVLETKTKEKEIFLLIKDGQEDENYGWYGWHPEGKKNEWRFRKYLAMLSPINEASIKGFEIEVILHRPLKRDEYYYFILM